MKKMGMQRPIAFLRENTVKVQSTVKNSAEFIDFKINNKHFMALNNLLEAEDFNKDRQDFFYQLTDLMKK